jgi:hypothetical protein
MLDFFDQRFLSAHDLNYPIKFVFGNPLPTYPLSPFFGLFCDKTMTGGFLERHGLTFSHKKAD